MGYLEELRVNLRLRLGLVAIMAILIIYGLLEWRDHLASATTDYRRLLNQVARLGQQKQPEQWQKRAVEARQALAEARAQLWHNASSGLAQAQVQDWLNGVLRQADAKAYVVRVSEPDTALDSQSLKARLPQELSQLVPLRARVEFNSDPAVLLALLAAMNDSRQRIVVDTLNIKALKTDMTLTFWFEITAESKP